MVREYSSLAQLSTIWRMRWILCLFILQWSISRESWVEPVDWQTECLLLNTLRFRRFTPNWLSHCRPFLECKPFPNATPSPPAECSPTSPPLSRLMIWLPCQCTYKGTLSHVLHFYLTVESQYCLISPMVQLCANEPTTDTGCRWRRKCCGSE
jgi:hypothetical protein